MCGEMRIHIYIYIYIERERERERDGEKWRKKIGDMLQISIVAKHTISPSHPRASLCPLSGAIAPLQWWAYALGIKSSRCVVCMYVCMFIHSNKFLLSASSLCPSWLQCLLTFPMLTYWADQRWICCRVVQWQSNGLLQEGRTPLRISGLFRDCKDLLYFSHTHTHTFFPFHGCIHLPFLSPPARSPLPPHTQTYTYSLFFHFCSALLSASPSLCVIVRMSARSRWSRTAWTTLALFFATERSPPLWKTALLLAMGFLSITSLWK